MKGERARAGATGGFEMAGRRDEAKRQVRRGATSDHLLYHKDGTVWAKGRKREGVATGYWEWFRKDGTRMRSGYFTNGDQSGDWTTYDAQGRAVKVTPMKAKPDARKLVLEPKRGNSRAQASPKARRGTRRKGNGEVSGS
jgi:hypothetical protein